MIHFFKTKFQPPQKISGNKPAVCLDIRQQCIFTLADGSLSRVNNKNWIEHEFELSDF